MLTLQNTRDEFASRPCTTAVLPVGALEQHGQHLPVGTDILLAQSVAEELASKLDAYLLPPLAITSSIEHRKAKGTVYLRADTLALVLRDIAASLRESGFRRLVLANFHGGNWILKPALRQLNRDWPDFRVVLLAPELAAADSAEIFAHPSGDVHGGEFETSLMLHLHPDEVRALPPPENATTVFPPQSFLDYFDTTELTPVGHWGWPAAATAEKGRKAFERWVASGLRTLEQIEETARTLAAASPAEATLRRMELADVTRAMELKNLAGWNQTEKDWRGYLQFEPEGCFVAEAGGVRAGTATTLAYGDRVGWIGMVLVHPDARRFGIGTRLLRHAIDYLQRRGVACVKLDATPLGKKVYVPLGFRDEYELSRYEGLAPAGDAATAPAVQYLTDGDLAEVTAFDAPLFGAERGAVLRSMGRRNPELCFVSRDASGVRGYLIAREGQNAVQLGPWVARDAAVAQELVGAFFRRVTGKKVFVDVPHPNAAGCTLIAKHGFTVQRGYARMFLGENRHPGQPACVFGTSGAEKG